MRTRFQLVAATLVAATLAAGFLAVPALAQSTGDAPPQRERVRQDRPMVRILIPLVDCLRGMNRCPVCGS